MTYYVIKDTANKHISTDEFIEGVNDGTLKIMVMDYEHRKQKLTIFCERVKKEFKQCYYDKFHVSQIEISSAGVGFDRKFIKKVWIVYEGKFEWCKWNDSLIFENEEIANKVCKKLNEVKR